MLTERQAQFLGLIAEGLSYDEIGAQCFCSRWTVKNTLVSARERLGARNLPESVSRAISLGEIFPKHLDRT